MGPRTETSRTAGGTTDVAGRPAPGTSTGISVLHVDDDASFAGFLRDWFETTDDGLRLTTVTSAEDAMERLSVPGHGFDVVVSDFRMPGTDGLELFELVHERDRSLPFVLFTGQGSEEVARDALTAGVTDYVRKSSSPDTLALLVNRIRNAVEARRLTEQTRGYDALVELLDIAVFVLDGAGRLISFNDSFVRLVGGDPSSLRGADVECLSVESERELLAQYVRGLTTDDGPDMASFRLNFRTGSGDVHPCRVDVTSVPGWAGRSANYVGVLRDLSERDRFRLTIADLLGWAAGPYLALDDEWRITVLNGPAERLLGRDEPGLVGRSLWEVYPAFEDSTFHERLTAVTESGEPVEFETYYGPTAEHFGVRAYPTSAGLAVYFRDVTERVERERELDLQRQRLAEFASIVSHDLRGPLAVARGHLSLLREAVDGEDGSFEAIDGALGRAEAIIDDTLTFARDVEIDDPGPTDLVDVAQRAWAVVPAGEGSIEVYSGPTIRADPGGLQRILENLLRNAVVHADGPPTVTIGWIESDETTTGFYVEDDGPGIPVEERDAVFDSGVTTREDGTGLGLAIVRQIVLAHGWEVRATEGTNGGARFEITGVDPVPDPSPSHEVPRGGTEDTRDRAS